MARIHKFVLGSGAALVAGLTTLLGFSVREADAAPSASTLYQEAMATTKSWTVHYVSTSDIANIPFVESGDAGPASGTQTILIGKGATLDSASLIVIGDLTYVRGNEVAMEDLIGLPAAQAATATGHWVAFSSTNPSFSQVVTGVRSHDVAQEVGLKGPFTLGPTCDLNGHKVVAVRGTQRIEGEKEMKAVLYVRAQGRHLLVEEETVGTHQKPNGAEDIVFSRWGEQLRPKAPDVSITLGPVNATWGTLRGARRREKALTWENRSLSSRRRGCQRESTMRRKYQIIGTIAASLASVGAGSTAVAATADAATSAKALYQAALKAAASQNVHYVSRATEQGISLEVIGDTGKTSGTQVLEVRNGSTTEELEVILFGSTGYIRGNAAGLEKVLGLTAAQSATYKNRWLSFPTSNTALAELVSGLRNSDVASELEMTGPYVLGGTKEIAGHETQAIKGSAATSSGTKVPIVLYVDASGAPRPVEEVTNPNAKSTSITGTVTFSKWGEKTNPKAPVKSVPLVPLLPAG